MGRPLALAVDPGRFHFFDVETGVSLLAASKREAAEQLPNQLAPAVR